MNDGREVCVCIDALEIIRGRVAVRENAEVLTRAKTHKIWLAQTFEELQR